MKNVINHYYRYPTALVLNNEMKEKTKMLLVVLIQLQEYNDKIEYSNSGLAKLVNTSPRNIQYSKNELSGLGLIKIDNSKDEEKGNLPSSITIVPEKINEYFQDEVIAITRTVKKEAVSETRPVRRLLDIEYYAKRRKQ